MMLKRGRIVFYMACIAAVLLNPAMAQDDKASKTEKKPDKTETKLGKFIKTITGQTKRATTKEANKKKLEEEETKRINAILKKAFQDSALLTKKREEEEAKRLISIAKKAREDSLILQNSIRALEKDFKSNINRIDQKALNDLNNPALKPINFSELIDKRIPAAEAQDAQNAIEQQEKLALLRTLYAKNIVVTKKIDKNTSVRFNLSIKHKAEVWGFLKDDPINTDYNFNIISNLVYNSYILDGKTGLNKISDRWPDVLAKAKQAKCKITIAVTAKNQDNIITFLNEREAQKTFIEETLKLLKNGAVDGINLDFGKLHASNSYTFLRFIRDLAEAYKPKGYKISITLPAIDYSKGYNLNQLQFVSDYFLVDFSTFQGTTSGAPIAPLIHSSAYNISTCISRYLLSPVKADKFILCLPYHGIKWNYNQNKPIREGLTIPYNEIRTTFQTQVSAYDKVTATHFINLKDDKGNDLRNLIYYDDTRSLGVKYDFVIKAKLGGVAIQYLNESDGFGELTDQLAYKFLVVDTLSRDTISHNKTWWQNTKYSLWQYGMGLEYPCDPQYDKVDTTLIDQINMVLVVICLAISGFCILNIKKHGTGWKYKQRTIIILIVFVVLLIISAFIGLFLDGNIPWFGLGNPCIAMPFRILFLIIIAGLVLGLIIMRLLIFPVIQREDKP